MKRRYQLETERFSMITLVVFWEDKFP